MADALGTTNWIAEAIIDDIFDNHRHFLPGQECRPDEVRDHLQGQILVDGLDPEERLLILSVLPRGPSEIRLAETDKGLSRSKTFQARYQAVGRLSKRFVVKVGEHKSIEREAHAVEQLVAPMLSGTNNPIWRRGPAKAIIAQELVGLGRVAELTSLRNAIRASPAGRFSVRSLLRDTLEPWYGEAITDGSFDVELGSLLARYIKKGGAPNTPPGWSVLFDWVEQISGVVWQPPESRLEALQTRTIRVPRSISHGDLHSQNVLVDPSGRCWPIDFAWCTGDSSLIVDLVMLECSLKFLAFPMRADLREMIELETRLSREYVYTGSLGSMPYVTEVGNVLGGVIEIRQFAHDAGITFDDYLACLCMMTSSLATHDRLNRPLVLSSLQILMGLL